MFEDSTMNDRIEEQVAHLLGFMEDANDYDEDFKSMFAQLTKVLELRQKELDRESVNAIKLQELRQQKDITDEAHSIKLQELQQQKSINEASNALKTYELQQQRNLADDANAIKREELDLKKSITKEALLNVGVHIAGLIVLMNHERAHVVASKAFGFVKKIF